MSVGSIYGRVLRDKKKEWCNANLCHPTALGGSENHDVTLDVQGQTKATKEAHRIVMRHRSANRWSRSSTLAETRGRVVCKHGLWPASVKTDLARTRCRKCATSLTARKYIQLIVRSGEGSSCSDQALRRACQREYRRLGMHQQPET
mgnify:CR=1 FL=1